MSVSATESLISCLLQMAEAGTNPVLEVIDLEKSLEVNKKYPSGLLQFNQTGWRAYYHCHPASRAGNHRFKGEHGHFHIFVRTQIEPERWSHLAALAMDHMGQPLGWFTVNHWVTGEGWESAEVLTSYLNEIPFDAQDTLVEYWILALLDLCRDTLVEILQKRDKIIRQKQYDAEALDINAKVLDIKKDKALYLLSENAIHLEELLDRKVRYN